MSERTDAKQSGVWPERPGLLEPCNVMRGDKTFIAILDTFHPYGDYQWVKTQGKTTLPKTGDTWTRLVPATEVEGLRAEVQRLKLKLKGHEMTICELQDRVAAMGRLEAKLERLKDDTRYTGEWCDWGDPTRNGMTWVTCHDGGGVHVSYWDAGHYAGEMSVYNAAKWCPVFARDAGMIPEQVEPLRCYRAKCEGDVLWVASPRDATRGRWECRCAATFGNTSRKEEHRDEWRALAALTRGEG